MTIHILERSTISALQHILKKHDIALPDGFLNDALMTMIQSLMEIEVSQSIDASRYERNGTRRAYRNGYRESGWHIHGENLVLRIPKLRSGTYYPSFLDSNHATQAILSTILQSYLHHVSYQTLSDLLDTIGLEAHPSQIATLEETLYDLIENHRQRDLSPSSIQLDIIPVDDNGRKRYLAYAFDEDELLHHDIISEADDEFWRDFVRRLDGRIIHGVEYVIVSRVHTVVRYARTTSPNMALVA
ncbi:MAG: transposase [Chloroflexota bacterium]